MKKLMTAGICAGMKTGRIKAYLLVILALSLTLPSASAHSGGTDSSGGHTNHSTGEYHYHHGYPAHQHPNGVCPYESTNANNSSSDSSDGSSNSDGSLNRYVESVVSGVPVEDLGKSTRQRIEEQLTLDSLYKTTKTKLKQANEKIDELSIEVAELKGRNTYLEKENTNLQAEIDTYKDKYLSIGIAVGIALVMGSIILIARNSSLKRQLLSERKQPSEENSN